MRYAFSPGDFGLIDMKVSFPDTYHGPRDVWSIDDEEGEELDEVTFGEVDIEEEEEEEEEGAPTFESFNEDLGDVDNEEESEFEALDEDFEDIEDDDKEFPYDDDEFE
jgi:hypothetical protein